jgi:hypothetical protein
MPAELMSTIAATVTMKIRAATSRLRSKNSSAGEYAEDVAGRRALRPPTRSFHWFLTDIELGSGS